MQLRQVESPSQIKEEIIRLRAMEGLWRTNLFSSDDELSRWCAKVGLSIFAADGSFFLLRHRDTFCHAYFCTVNLADAKNALFALTQKVEIPISMDILGEDDNLQDMLLQIGFRHAVTLKRMTRPNDDMQAENLLMRDDEYARSDELPFLMGQLRKNFDPLTKQLPDEDELLRMIEQKNIIAVRTQEHKLQGFLVFEPQGAALLLRYIAVMEAWRGKALGGTLLKKFLGIRHGVRKHQLWVKNENLPAVRLYEKHGFRFDGLEDDVFVFQP